MLVAAASSSCLQQGYVQLAQREDELVASEVVRSFIKANPNASIVLRVPNTPQTATQSDLNTSVYNAIEKELVMAGFNVKDRGLFNQALKSDVSMDYSQIANLSGTDLILELVKVDLRVPIKTNRAYTKHGEEKVLDDLEYTRYGASIEFKMVLVRTNAYGGSFSFYHTPCTDRTTDCQCKVPYKYGGKFYPDYVARFCSEETKRNVAYEYYPIDVFEQFVRERTRELIEVIRQ